MRALRLTTVGAVAACRLLAIDVPLAAPPGFEENRGQFPPDVAYAFRPWAYLTNHSLELTPEALSIQFEGANPATVLEPSATLAYTVNVYSGAKAVTGIRRFGQVRYANLYPGIDLVFPSASTLTWRFIVQPGANLASIILNYGDAHVTTEITGDTGLVLWFKFSRMGQNSAAYQGTVPVGVHYKELGGNRYGFTLDAYDPTLPVTIETTLPLSGTGPSKPTVVAPSGALYAEGAEPALFETCAADGVPKQCFDATVYRYSPAGTPAWITYLTGRSDDRANALTVDSNDSAYIAGDTASPDFPTTALPDQPQTDGFAAKLDRDGHLVYSTYIGGPVDDSANQIHTDASGNAYIAGPCSNGLPVTAGALKATPCTSLPYYSQWFGYLAKIDRNGGLAYLTYLPETPSTFVVDPEGNVYIGGRSDSGNAYVAKLDPTGSTLTYSFTYSHYGAADVESLALDANRNVWFDGHSVDTGSRYSGYLAKLSADGSKILYESRFLGGEIAMDPAGRLVALSRDVPATVHTAGGVLTSACGSATVSLLDASGTVLLNRPDNEARGISVGLLLTGYPKGISIVAVQPATRPDAACVLNSASLAIPNVIAPGEIITVFGLGIGPVTGQAATLDASGRVPDTVAGVRVLFDGAAVPVLYADSGQINAIAPFSLAPGSTTLVEVEVQGHRAPAIAVAVKDTVPSLFTQDGSGQGRVLAFNQDATLNSPENPAKLGTIVTLFATGTGVTSPASEAGAIAQSIDARPAQIPAVVLYGKTGGIPLTAVYAGPSPGSITSVTQFNLRLPESIPFAEYSYSPSAWPIAFLDTALEFATISIAP